MPFAVGVGVISSCHVSNSYLFVQVSAYLPCFANSLPQPVRFATDAADSVYTVM